jgi:serine/threonine-protein kinase RsbT
MPTLQDEVEVAKLPVARTQDVLLARLIVREEGARMGFAAHALTQLATCVSEIARNVVEHAGATGQVRVFVIADGGRRGLRIAVQDAGRGIDDVGRALAGASPGAGIPGCRRLMDEFSIESSAGKGTTVVMSKWLAGA